jgi:non-heme chloroperoxidase
VIAKAGEPAKHRVRNGTSYASIACAYMKQRSKGMKRWSLRIFVLAALVRVAARADDGASPNPAATQFVDIGKGIKLEVLDWGGTGPPLVLLAAIGSTAHVYDAFGPKLAAKYHVYGITRRGFGASSVPPSGYSADQLGDDVLAVIAALKINRPILVGHSMSGEELSSVGSRHPEKVRALIYMEAAYPFAFYDSVKGDLRVDADELRDRIDRLVTGRGGSDPRLLIAGIMESLPQFERDLQSTQKRLEGMPQISKRGSPPPDDPLPAQAMAEGEQKFTSVGAPILAIFSYPHSFGGKFQNDPAGLAKAEAVDLSIIDAQIEAVKRDAPTAHIVRIPNAAHKIFKSNEADVLREIDSFVGGLPGT